jgi:hypothetical protein
MELSQYRHTDAMYVGGEAIIELINGLAEHDITLVQFGSVYTFAMTFLISHRFSLRFRQLGSVLS